MTWANLVDLISNLINNYGLEILSSLVLAYLGIRGGFAIWIAKWIFKKAADYFIAFAKRKAEKADQKNIDDKNEETVQNLIDQKAPESALIEAEENFLNGIKKTRKD